MPGSCSRAIAYVSNVPLLFITIGAVATTTGGLTFILLIARLPRFIAAAFIYVMLILAGLVSAVKEYCTNSAST